jgi:hypothetical protein
MIQKLARNVLRQFRNEQGILVTVYKAKKAPRGRTANSNGAVQTREKAYGV